MRASLERHIDRLLRNGLDGSLRAGLVGLEKETLRVSRAGTLSARPHPRELGSALTHSYITTDYSEALLEFITPPFDDLGQAHRFLLDIERFVYDRLDNEILWATSMPCVLAGENSIPIARYGDSNPGRMKYVYRRGLGFRYGRVMQVIAGVHFNYSLPDGFWDAWRTLHDDRRPLRAVRDDVYFRLIRNLLRFGWTVPYLFGASPAVCKTFLIGKPRRLQEFDANTAYEPYATSLRLSDIGYQNRKEDRAGVRASYNCVDDYVDKLQAAIVTPYPDYERIGVCVDGDWRQLNANILQIAPSRSLATRAGRKCRRWPCAGVASSTWSCVRSMSAPSSRPGSRATSCTSSRPSCCSARCATARRSMPEPAAKSITI